MIFGILLLACQVVVIRLLLEIPYTIYGLEFMYGMSFIIGFLMLQSILNMSVPLITGMMVSIV